MSLTFEEKLAIERAEMVRLIDAARAAVVPSVGLPRDVNNQIRSLLREARIDEARQTVLSYLENSERSTRHPG